MGKRSVYAERRARTTSDLIDAADRLFVTQGFHATSIDQIAVAAGYTKGAVYSNFASKDDLFLAVYARRVERALDEVNAMFEELGPLGGLEHMSAEILGPRREDSNGWLAAFFEFWAHVVRHPESRERFAELHRSIQAPMARAVQRYADDHDVELPETAAALNTAMTAMMLGLSLERLTQPDLVDADLGARMTRFVLTELAACAARTVEEETSS